MKLLVTTTLLCMTIVAGQVPVTPNPKPCCTPKQYEVHVAASVSQEHGKTVNIDMTRFSMDFTRNMSSVVEYIPGVGVITSILDYNKQLVYVIMNDDDKLVCKKTKLPPAEMISRCLPKNSKFMGKTKMGYGKQSLDCDKWFVERNLENPSSSLEIFLVTQSDGCVPIVEQVTLKAAGTTLTEGASYFDFTPGIKDPSVFTIPAICDKAKSLDLSELSDTANSLIRKSRK